MKPSVVIDTNVAVVANGKAHHTGHPCALNCIRALRECRNHNMILIDDLGLIFEEYRKHLSFAGQPGPGDAFFKWLWDNQGNLEHCRKISITPVNGDFEEFPDDPQLVGFDLDDRKYVAVVLASGDAPTIINAADTDWWNFRAALRIHNIIVQFLCPELMEKDR